MSIAADRDYAHRKNFKYWSNTYLKRDKDFSGSILFHNLNGEFVNGWIYCDGQITHSITDPDNIDVAIQLKVAAERAVYVYYESCTDYYSIGSVNGTVVSVEYKYTSCSGEWVNIGSYGIETITGTAITTSGGGGSGAYIPPTPQPCNCANICPTCGKCLDYGSLKSAVLPDTDAPTTTTPTDPCEYCAGHLEPVPPVIEDPSFTDTKADCVKTKLDNGAIINCLLGGFDLNSSSINLTFRVASIESNGECYWDQNNQRMEITINTARLDDSSVEIARTILHESFHAYMFGKLYESELHTGLAPEPNFDNDFKAYQAKFGDGGSGSAQHNYMADNYITYMKQGLSDYFNGESYKDEFLNNVSDNDYWYGTDFLFECIAWGGLKGTEAWATFQADAARKLKYDQTMGIIARQLPKENCINP